MLNSAETFLDVAQHHSKLSGDKIFITWLKNGETELDRYTFAEIDQRAKAMAINLQKTIGLSPLDDLCVDRKILQNTTKSRPTALIVVEPSLNFVVAFFGCIYAGIAAVPAYPLKRNESSERLIGICEDSSAELLIFDSSTIASLESCETLVTKAKYVSVESSQLDDAKDWRHPGIGPEDIAFIQYTSGSTGKPKGVLVTHRNIISNQEMIKQSMGHSSDTVFVGWLPMYHDMGLVGNLMQPFYLGVHCVMMAPLAFVIKPIRWLKAIAKYGGTTSGAPNFAYDLCVTRTTIKQRQGLDLSSWQVAYNGAEPVRWAVLERFYESFKEYGLKKESLFPCYGMAESTLIITGGPYDASPSYVVLESEALKNDELRFVADRAPLNIDVMSSWGNTQQIVSCGVPVKNCEVKIVRCNTDDVNPLGMECRSDEIGEIWVSGDHVAGGYKNQTVLSDKTFEAKLIDNEKTYLRTGDLGFLKAGELYVTGRSKDLIIISGKNHYPQEIELSCLSANVDFGGMAAAFSVDVDGTEVLIVVVEVQRRRQEYIDEVNAIESVKMSVSAAHGISPAEVVLVKSSSIPTTSSGKVQRRQCRSQFFTHSLNVIPKCREKLIGEVYV